MKTCARPPPSGTHRRGTHRLAHPARRAIQIGRHPLNEARRQAADRRGFPMHASRRVWAWRRPIATYRKVDATGARAVCPPGRTATEAAPRRVPSPWASSYGYDRSRAAADRKFTPMRCRAHIASRPDGATFGVTDCETGVGPFRWRRTEGRSRPRSSRFRHRPCRRPHRQCARGICATEDRLQGSRPTAPSATSRRQCAPSLRPIVDRSGNRRAPFGGGLTHLCRTPFATCEYVRSATIPE